MRKNTFIIFVAILYLLFITGCHNNKKDSNDINTPIQQQTQVLEQDVSNASAQEKIPEIKKTTTSFLGVGDNIIYGTKEARIHAEGSGELYDYKPYYKGVAHLIKQADISFINQETLMCGDGYSLSYYPMFNSPQKVGLDLIELGFDIINISNNHMLDKGSDGLLKTIDFWKNSGVFMVGGYENREDFENIRVYEKDGLKIAFLSYCEMTNGLTKSPSSNVVIPYLEEDVITRQVNAAKELSNLVFVSVHWGDEGSFVPNETQEHYAQLFADLGVNVILGHHPHVIQPVKWLEGKDGGKTLCVYSLGNFMAQQDRDYNMVGGMISFDIIHSQGENPEIENVVYTPTVFHFNGSFTDNNVYLFENYSDKLAQNHGVRQYYGHSFSFDRLKEYVNNTIGNEFLPDSLKAVTDASES